MWHGERGPRVKANAHDVTTLVALWNPAMHVPFIKDTQHAHDGL